MGCDPLMPRWRIMEDDGRFYIQRRFLWLWIPCYNGGGWGRAGYDSLTGARTAVRAAKGYPPKEVWNDG